jgi:hypothetical protein
LEVRAFACGELSRHASAFAAPRALSAIAVYILILSSVAKLHATIWSQRYPRATLEVPAMRQRRRTTPLHLRKRMRPHGQLRCRRFLRTVAPRRGQAFPNSLPLPPLYWNEPYKARLAVMPLEVPPMRRREPRFYRTT